MSARSSTSSRAESATSTRARVIDATIDCILDEGLYRASSNRIAKRAGVSWGVIQHHFGSREALLLAAFQSGMSELIDHLESAAITGDTFEARLESFADVIWRFYRQPKFIAYEQLTLNLLRDPTMDAATVRLVRRRQAKIGELLNGLATQVVDDEIASVLPPMALLQDNSRSCNRARARRSRAGPRAKPRRRHVFE